MSALKTAAAPAALALVGVLALGACSSGEGSGPESGSGPDLKVSGAYVPEPVKDDMAGGFLTVTNSGDEADNLTSVTGDFAEETQMHETVDQKMQQVKSLPVPANGELDLSRGGNHLMFLELKRKPAEGDKVSLTLHFEKSGPVKVSVPVEAMNHVPEK